MELLKDPYNDRVVKSLPLPPHKPLTLSLAYQKFENIPDLDLI